MFTLREYICICTHAHTLTHTYTYTYIKGFHLLIVASANYFPIALILICRHVHVPGVLICILTLCILLLKMYIYMIKAHADYILNLRHLKTDDTHFIHYKLHACRAPGVYAICPDVNIV